MRQDEDKNLYLYIRSVYEDERTVEEVFRSLADRADIELKIPISPEKFKKNLKNESSKLLDKEETAEKYEFILDRQAEVCMQIFRKPICVLSGAAQVSGASVAARAEFALTGAPSFATSRSSSAFPPV